MKLYQFKEEIKNKNTKTRIIIKRKGGYESSSKINIIARIHFDS